VCEWLGSVTVWLWVALSVAVVPEKVCVWLGRFEELIVVVAAPPVAATA
jgi:hypothetical protein